MRDETIKIAWKSVTKSFGRKTVLEGLDLVAYEGRSLVIIGGSGTGKSVTIKLALGLLRPDSGSVEIDGEAVEYGRENDPGVQQIGMLFQSGALFDSLSVWENVSFRLLHAEHVKKDEAKERAIAALDQVDLEADIADRRPAELSGGMQRRVALARAVVGKPNILFFDEPTTGLDPVTADLINQLIVRQVKTLGATAVTITHDMASMRAIADEVAMIRDGNILWRGDLEGVDSCENPTVCDFVAGRYSPEG
ncbi:MULTISPECIES: ABC transporter ATP-binding protein [Marinicauda]|jgi:phospholipid/cholesterol/gamma-HCH transport system ATP-binding protein|uniref:ABC transporter ATP-binding protein n=1 Tax=Marinicauda TaxID=1649466 RepID=UPI0022E85940|nr:ATP-binding cassette domain-containing protein [Marinicauda sp. Alg238-R41]